MSTQTVKTFGGNSFLFLTVLLGNAAMFELLTGLNPVQGMYGCQNEKDSQKRGDSDLWWLTCGI